jgi:FMN-dependent NADH-azoreductase
LQLSPIDGFWVGASYTPADARTLNQARALAVSDSLIADLQQADEYVFGVPMHNFSIPSTLKLWIDQVVRAGQTFAYGAGAPKGLLTGKKATLLLASGGVYGEGTATAALVTVITAGGTAQLMSGKIDSQTFLAPSLERVHAHASLQERS